MSTALCSLFDLCSHITRARVNILTSRESRFLAAIYVERGILLKAKGEAHFNTKKLNEFCFYLLGQSSDKFHFVSEPVGKIENPTFQFSLLAYEQYLLKRWEKYLLQRRLRPGDDLYLLPPRGPTDKLNAEEHRVMMDMGKKGILVAKLYEKSCYDFVKLTDILISLRRQKLLRVSRKNLSLSLE